MLKPLADASFVDRNFITVYVVIVLVAQIPPIILACLLYWGAGLGLLARVLQVLGNCAMRLLVK
jgi:hypothetical protein